MAIGAAASRRGIVTRGGSLGGWLSERWSAVVAAVILLALLAVLAWQSGGYFPSSHLRAGAIALVAAGVLLLAGPRVRTTRRGLVALAALAGLTLWTGLSAGWSPTPVVAFEDFQRALVYVGLFGLALLAASSRRVARALPWAALALITAVVGHALLGRLQPDVVAPAPFSELNGYRLAQPLGYWNALGALSVVGLVLALGLAAERRGRVVPRGAAAGAAVLFALAGYLTLSRGAWIALAVGLAALLVAAPSRRSLLVSAAIVAAGAGALVTGLQEHPALVDDPAAGSGQEDAGNAFTPLVVLVTVVAVAAQALAASTQQALRRAVMPTVVRRAALVALAVAGLAGAAAYAAESAELEGRAAAGVIDAEDFVGRQWDEFWDPQTYNATGSERLTSARGTRGALYRVAWDGWQAAPLRGEGAGAFEVRWMQDRKVEEKVRDAHSLYLETLNELGLVGILLLLGFAGALATGAWLVCRDRQSRGAARGAVVAAALAAWFAHAGVDWDWQMPAVTGVMLLLAATLCAPGARARRVRS